MHASQHAQKLACAGLLLPQDPWIQNATLRDNVLMGLPYDAAKYAQALAASCLDADVQVVARRWTGQLLLVLHASRTCVFVVFAAMHACMHGHSRFAPAPAAAAASAACR